MYTKTKKDFEKAIWQFINSKSKLKPEIPDLIINSDNDHDDTTTISLDQHDQSKANLFADYFSSVYIMYIAEVEKCDPTIYLTNLEDITVSMLMPNIIFTETNIKKTFISRLKQTTSSSGPDDLHPRFLKETICNTTPADNILPITY